MNLGTVMRAGAVLALAVASQACATLHGDARAARTSGACARTAIADLDARTAGDKRAHCIGAGLIARRCSVAEAMAASYAKEMRDLFGRGNAEAADLHASRAGIACARADPAAASLAQCCEARGY
jgi:hypothetical protein